MVADWQEWAHLSLPSRVVPSSCVDKFARLSRTRKKIALEPGSLWCSTLSLSLPPPLSLSLSLTAGQYQAVMAQKGKLAHAPRTTTFAAGD